jgi:hypothetical protein
VATLLEQAALVEDSARPGRTRARLEKALERLEEDDLLGGWAYTAHPLELPARGWLPIWRAATIWLTPPAGQRAIYRRQQARLPAHNA